MPQVSCPIVEIQTTAEMTERRNTIVCTFEMASPKMTACDIHEWIYDTLRLPEEEIRMIQIDGIKRQVYIKLTEQRAIINLLQTTTGQVECKHHNGEITKVTINMAGMGNKRIRIANLPPEVPENVVKTALTPYGTVMDIHEEKWARTYRYVVANGIKQVMMSLTKHIPSHLTIEGHRVLVSYEGQPTTCYGCGEVGHIYPNCPNRQAMTARTNTRQPSTYASTVTKPPTHTQQTTGEPADAQPKNDTAPNTDITTDEKEEPQQMRKTTMQTRQNRTTENQTNAIRIAQPDQSTKKLEQTTQEQADTPPVPLEEETEQKEETDEQTNEMTRNKPQIGPKQRKTLPQQEQSHNIKDDERWETMDTEPQKPKQEGNGEETHQHPKRQKKMKSEKQSAPITEYTSIMTRKVNTKTGKP